MQSHASMSLLQEEIAEEPEYGDAIDSDDDDRFVFSVNLNCILGV